MTTLQANQIIPFLWYNNQAEEAMNLYTAVFPNSKIENLKRWETGGPMEAGKVMMGSITINGLSVHMFDAGPQFTFNESMSFFVNCDTQDEIDHYWKSLTADGGQESRCGWLKDKFGFSWQIVPRYLSERLQNGDPLRAGQMFEAVMGMDKLVIAELEAAYER